MTRSVRSEWVEEVAFSRKLPLRRGLRREDAARYVGVSASYFDDMVNNGRMPRPFRVADRVVLWDVPRVHPQHQHHWPVYGSLQKVRGRGRFQTRGDEEPHPMTGTKLREDKMLKSVGLKGARIRGDAKVASVKTIRVRKPPMCEECGKNRADPPGKLCVGCEAYRDHTSHF